MKLEIVSRLVVCLATCACPALLVSGCSPEVAPIVVHDVIDHFEKHAAIEAETALQKRQEQTKKP